MMNTIGGALAKHPAGIFELNALLLGLQPKQDRKDEEEWPGFSACY